MNKSSIKKVIKHIEEWFIKYYDVISSIFTSLLSIAFSLVASVFYGWLTNGTTENTEISEKAALFIKIVLIAAVLIIIVLSSVISQRIRNRIIVKSRYKDYIEKAYLKIQDLSFESQAVLQNTIMDNNNVIDSECLLQWSLNGLRQAIYKCYDFFLDTFGSANEFIEQIRFEVTFMTESYRDKELTIACYCNRERMEPTSMMTRKTDAGKTIYKNTVAAELYSRINAHEQPAMIIIADTKEAVPDTDGKEYVELYAGQRENSKSSIVVPVLSRRLELLGVLVVYCNQTNFFKEEDRDFWEAMMQLFTVEIGSYKLILEPLYQSGEVEAPF